MLINVKQVRIKNNLYRIKTKKDNEFKKLIPKKYLFLRAKLTKSIVSFIIIQIKEIKSTIDAYKLSIINISKNRKRFNYIKKYYSLEHVNPNKVINNNFMKYSAYKIPAINLYIIDCSFITTPMSIINYNEKLFFSEHDDFNVHVIPDELLDINLRRYCKTKKIRTLKECIGTLSYPSAMAITSNLSNNYFHWIVDYLPRIILFYQDKKNQDIPLILSSSIHKNLIESITKFNSKIRIHLVDNFVGIKIKKQYYVSPVSTFIFDYRKKIFYKKYGSQIGYSLKFFRDFKKNYPKIKINSKFNKVFIVRNSSYRKITNQKKVIAALKKLGFLIIDFNSTPFIEQQVIFNSASIIVSPIGATLANMVFSNKNQCIIALTSNHPDHVLTMFTNLSYASSMCKIHFFYGSKATFSIHDNYSIDTDLLSKEIENLPNFSMNKNS